GQLLSPARDDLVACDRHDARRRRLVVTKTAVTSVDSGAASARLCRRRHTWRYAPIDDAAIRLALGVQHAAARLSGGTPGRGGHSVLQLVPLRRLSTAWSVAAMVDQARSRARLARRVRLFPQGWGYVG